MGAGARPGHPINAAAGGTFTLRPAAVMLVTEARGK